jgi:maltooligosyltrehalose trehalohydrolase
MRNTFTVWAPNATTVELDVLGRRHAMSPQEMGWYSVDLEVSVEEAYGFAIDGGEVRPDPRSHAQPHGVHGPSQLVDHRAFEWHDAEWHGFALRDAVIYELHVGTFTSEGGFDAAIERLEHLVALGVNAIELMPVVEFPGTRGWGYDGVDLFAPHHAYGGPDGLKRLVDACHARGLAVVLDVVYNHLGPEGNYLPEFGPYLTDRYTTPWGHALNVDGPDSDAVRDFVLANAEMWLRDYHCDGLRLDAVHELYDISATHILESVAQHVERLRGELGRELWVIAESDSNDPRLVRERDRGGYGLDAQWSDNFHHSLHALLTGERNGYYVDFGGLEAVVAALRHAFVYTGQYSTYRRRRFGRPIGDLPLARFLGYAQNHDQAGNRARGERLSQLVSPGRARVAAALTLLSPFVPLLFAGEEWAASTPFQYFTDLGDRWLRRSVSEGRRHEFVDFGWPPSDVPDPQAMETFERSRLRWDEVETGEHARMLAWYRDLVALRMATPALRDGDQRGVDAWCDEDSGALGYAKADLQLICNLGAAPISTAQVGEGAVLLLSSEPLLIPDASAPALIPPDAVAIWRTMPTR